MAALTYDSAALLADFARRKGITYPLLADPESRVIRAFGILNDNFPKDHAWFGVAFPGTYIVDETGTVKAKYFEDDHRDRYTAANILVKTSQAEPAGGWMTVETAHLKLRYSSTDPVVRTGSRVGLIVEVELKPKMHVYAPGVQQNYKPIAWTVAESSAWQAESVSFPRARVLHLKAINEAVPIYEGRLRLLRDLTIGQQNDIRPVVTDAKQIVVRGTLRYQACDDRQCFPPVSVPLEWKLRVEAHDSQRAPAELRRR